jgi:hypothetical protein
MFLLSWLKKQCSIYQNSNSTTRLFGIKQKECGFFCFIPDSLEVKFESKKY